MSLSRDGHYCVIVFSVAMDEKAASAGVPLPDSSRFGDLYYANSDEHKKPTVLIGRIIAATPEEGNRYIEKIKRFESRTVGKMLTIADDNFQVGIYHPIDFEHMAAELVNELQGDPAFTMNVSQFKLSEFSTHDSLPPNPAQIEVARSALVDSLNSENMLVTFYGQTDDSKLTDENILTPTGVERLTTLGLWVTMGCYLTRFDSYISIARQLLTQPKSGAVIFIGPSYLGYASISEHIIQQFYLRLFEDDEVRSVGEAYMSALESLPTRSNGSYTYLGDPGLVIRR